MDSNPNETYRDPSRLIHEKLLTDNMKFSSQRSAISSPNACKTFVTHVTVFRMFRASRLGLSLPKRFYTGVIKVKRNAS